MRRSSGTWGALRWRIAGASLFLVVALCAALALWPARQALPLILPAEPAVAAAAEPAPTPIELATRADAADLWVPPHLDPEVERALAEHQQRLTWREITGISRRADNGWPVRCTILALDADGKTLLLDRSRLGGTFILRAPPAATQLRFTAHDFDLEDATVGLAADRGLQGLIVVLPVARGAVKGSVVDESGLPVAGMTVRMNGRARETTNAGGNFVFRPVRDDRYLLSLPSAVFAPRVPSSQAVRVVGGLQQEPSLFVVARGALLQGVVTDQETETPLADVRVVLTRPDGGGDHRMVVTGEDGTFSFPRLLAGDYRITTTVPDSSYARVVREVLGLADGEVRDVMVALVSTAGMLAGRVLGPRGETVPFARVVARRQRKDVDSDRMETRTDTRGRFRFGSLPVGRWRIGPEPTYCESHNWLADATVDVELQAGHEAMLDLRLQRGCFLQGRVLSATSASGVLVRMHLPEGGTVEEPVGAEGGFAFGGVRPGQYLVEAVDPTLGSGSTLAQQTVYVTTGRAASIELHIR